MTAPRRTEREIARALRLEHAARSVDELRRAALAAEQEFAAELEAAAPSMRESAYNLVHYLAVRRHDVRELQDQLTRLGLSSLGRMEAHVMASLQAVLEVLCTLRDQPVPAAIAEAPPVTFKTGNALLAAHADAILGPARRGRATRIMVTMPGEAAEQPALIRDLVEAGMEVMRINCAHDTPKVWERMVRHLRRAERETGKRCAVSFDLAGPKLRTGPIAPGPAVAKWRPARDTFGLVTHPARVRFVARVHENDVDDATISVEGDLLAKAKPGDSVELADTRHRKRVLHVVEVNAGECLCETDTTAYVVPGTRLSLRRKGRAVAKGVVGPLPAVEQWIALRPGDVLDVVRGEMPGRDAVHDDDGRVLEPAFVSCALPEVFVGVRVGEPMLFDDGKIRGTIRAVNADRIRVEITAVAGGAAKLRAEKGINLPETALDLPALTAKDVADLAFVAKHADMVALSFVQRPEDIEGLLAEIDAARRGEARHRAQDRDAGGVRSPPGAAAGFDAPPAGGGDGRARRPGCRGGLRAAVRGAGRDPVAVRGGARAGDLGDAGAGVAGEGRPAVARRGHGRRDGQPRRVRDAQQGTLHSRNAALPDRRPRAHGGTPAQEDVAVAETARVGPEPTARANRRVERIARPPDRRGTPAESPLSLHVRPAARTCPHPAQGSPRRGPARRRRAYRLHCGAAARTAGPHCAARRRRHIRCPSPSPRRAGRGQG